VKLRLLFDESALFSEAEVSEESEPIVGNTLASDAEESSPAKVQVLDESTPGTDGQPVHQSKLEGLELGGQLALEAGQETAEPTGNAVLTDFGPIQPEHSDLAVDMNERNLETENAPVARLEPLLELTDHFKSAVSDHTQPEASSENLDASPMEPVSERYPMNNEANVEHTGTSPVEAEGMFYDLEALLQSPVYSETRFNDHPFGTLPNDGPSEPNIGEVEDTP
jgi:hypothetical protein